MGLPLKKLLAGVKQKSQHPADAGFEIHLGAQWSTLQGGLASNEVRETSSRDALHNCFLAPHHHSHHRLLRVGFHAHELRCTKSSDHQAWIDRAP